MISVAMASYNGEKYIEEQIRSILSNLSAEDELLISDDGSTDGTIPIIEKLSEFCRASNGARISLYEGPRKGIIANFESVIAKCRGDVIFLSDQDDVWAPNKVECVMETFEKTGATLVMHDAKVYDETLNQVWMDSFFAYRGSKPGFWNNVIKNRYMGCCMAFKRTMAEKMLPIPKNIQMHDQWLGLMNDLYGTKTVLLPECLIAYRRHEDANSDFSHHTLPVMFHHRCILMKEIIKRCLHNQ